jgi:hypothetical protein
MEMKDLESFALKLLQARSALCLRQSRPGILFSTKIRNGRPDFFPVPYKKGLVYASVGAKRASLV